MKCVMIVDEDLPIGLIANATAVLGISLSQEKEGLVGDAVIDGDGNWHLGITNVAIPILKMTSSELKKMYRRMLDNQDEELMSIAFNDVAQKSLNYEDYRKKLKAKRQDDLSYLGICLYGPKKKINKLTGNLKMLR